MESDPNKDSNKDNYENLKKSLPAKFSTQKHLYVPYFFPDAKEKPTNKPKLIVIDGLIGAAKSTFINIFVKYLQDKGKKVVIIKEPVDEWIESGLFQKFNEDRQRWGYTFQATAFHSRIMTSIEMYHEHGHDTDYFITERCVFSDSIFMKMLVEDKFVTEMEQKEYKKWFNLWYMLMPAIPDMFIWLQCDLDICMARIKKRNRVGEEKITKEYQKRLLDGYCEIMSSDKVIIDDVEVPCCHISTNQDFEDINNKDEAAVQQKMIEEVDTMLSKL